MCGFVGEIRFDGEKTDLNTLKICADIINYRGPDDSGLFDCQWAALAFKRLAIIDLSYAGHQPMQSKNNRYVIVFNGEIYNYKEIRTNLMQEGIKFYSQSDTEVVLSAFEKWGIEAPKRFVGMFAFVVLDLQDKKTYIVRDQLGIKPIYLMRQNKILHFASEIKAFRPLQKFELNLDVLFEQLSFGYVAGVNTLFKGVEKVEPGTVLVIDENGKTETHIYYDVADSLMDSKVRVDEHKIRKLITKSINQHTVSDVGYNLQLSGGVDSSYIVASLIQEQKKMVRTYSVTIDGELSEQPYQHEVVSNYPSDHYSLHYDPKNLAEAYVKSTWHMDAPNMHLASPFLMMLCYESAKTSKVILTGEGADELFGGYDRFKINLIQRIGFFLHKFNVPAWLIPNIPKIRALRPFLIENPVFSNQRLISFEMTNKLISPEIPKELKFRKNCLKRFNKLEDQIIVSHQKCYLQSILERQDKISMAASVEARVPFCSHPLFEQINRLPYSEKIKNGVTKSTLKNLAKKFFSNNFIYRRKSGFTIPIDEWLRDESGMGRYLSNLECSPFCDLPFFNHEEIKKMLDDRKCGRKSWHKELMILVNFDLWYQLFISETIKP